MDKAEARNVYKEYILTKSDTDFIIGVDRFENLSINEALSIKDWYYFQNSKKTIVKRFIMKRTTLSEKSCTVTLIKKENGKFEPRFVFEIRDLTKKAVETYELPVSNSETRLIKARVDLEDCHKEFTQLLDFLGECKDVEVASGNYAVITSNQRAQFEQAFKVAEKSDVVQAVREKYGHKLTEQDINIMAKRKETLGKFKRLLDEAEYMTEYRAWLQKQGKNNRPEDVWQHFFEDNRWIFGYGLQLVACVSLDDRKLETVVVGNDLFDGSGKRIDGLLKTQGAVNRALFTEIKRHDTALLEPYDRPGVFVPSKDLRGAVAQVQKTLHKVNLKVSKVFESIIDKTGNPTGESIAFVRPRGVVVIGRLSEFETEHGTNVETFASFELYRQQLTGIEILTYDELYARARYIIEES
jgi:hypothetical protein